MTVAQRLPIDSIPVTRPMFLTPPQERWRVFVMIDVWDKNRTEKIRAERDYVATARAYEIEAGTWSRIRHHLRAALLFEKAADCFEEAGKLNPKDIYETSRVRLLVYAAHALNLEIRANRTTHETYSVMARVQFKLGQIELSDSLKDIGNTKEEKERTNPAYAALCSIHRLQRERIEAKMGHEQVRQYEILIEIIGLTVAAAAHFDDPEAFKQKMVGYIDMEKTDLNLIVWRAIDAEVREKILSPPQSLD